MYVCNTHLNHSLKMNSVVSIFTAHELSIMNGLYGTTLLLTELTLHNGAQLFFDLAIVILCNNYYQIKVIKPKRSNGI